MVKGKDIRVGTLVSIQKEDVYKRVIFVNYVFGITSTVNGKNIFKDLITGVEYDVIDNFNGVLPISEGKYVFSPVKTNNFKPNQEVTKEELEAYSKSYKDYSNHISGIILPDSEMCRVRK